MTDKESLFRYRSRQSTSMFLIFNLILTILLLIVSLSFSNLVMKYFDSPAEFTFAKKALYHIGDLMAKYLILPIFLIPKSFRYSLIAGILSYISAFIMTLPITFVIYFTYRKIFGPKDAVVKSN